MKIKPTIKKHAYLYLAGLWCFSLALYFYAITKHNKTDVIYNTKNTPIKKAFVTDKSTQIRLASDKVYS